MSKKEYRSLVRSMKPFTTLFIVVMGASILASCGGGGDGGNSSGNTTSGNDRTTAQAVTSAATTVPGAWTGRVPTTGTPRPLSNGLPPVRTVISTEIYEGSRIAKREILITAHKGINFAQLKTAIENKGWRIVGNSGRSYQIDVSSSIDSMDILLNQMHNI